MSTKQSQKQYYTIEAELKDSGRRFNYNGEAPKGQKWTEDDVNFQSEYDKFEDIPHRDIVLSAIHEFGERVEVYRYLNTDEYDEDDDFISNDFIKSGTFLDI